MAEVAVVEFEDYESLPVHSIHVHLLAGAAAGTLEHTVMYPFDAVKTRMQSLCDCPQRKCMTPVGGLRSMIQLEGFIRPMRGISAIATGSIPAHAAYFTVYEKMKLFLTNGQNGHHPFAYGVSGIAATMVHDIIMNPAEVVKQRLQMWGSPYKGCVECARCVYNQEGLCAFYRSYTTQLAMNIPYQSLHFIIYEFWQQVLNPKHQYSPLTHVVAGGLAGGVAAAVTTPLDVVKTVLNTQQRPVMDIKIDHCPVSYSGIKEAVSSIYQLRGVPGFFCGLQARVLFQVPSTAISWMVYESFKYLLSGRNTE